MSILLSRLEWQLQAILVSARTSREGVKYTEMLASCIDIIQLSGPIPRRSLACFQRHLLYVVELIVAEAGGICNGKSSHLWQQEEAQQLFRTCTYLLSTAADRPMVSQ